MNKFYANIAAIIFSFIIVAFGQNTWIPFFGIFASIFGFGIFWFALESFAPRKKRFLISYFWFLFIQMIQLSWMSSTTYQGMYIIIVYFLVCSVIAITFAFFTMLIFYVKNRSLTFILALSGIWTIAELSRLYWFSGFTWNPVGLALANCQYSLQLISVVGVYGLSFWVIFVNLLNYHFLKKPSLKRVVFCAVAAFVPYFFGICHIVFYKKDFNQSEKMTVAMVQTNIFPEQKNAQCHFEKNFISPWQQWGSILRLLKQEIQKPIDLIVFPESCISFNCFAAVYPYELFLAAWEKIFPSNNTFPMLNRPLAEKDNADQWYISNAYWAQTLANYYHANVIIGLDDVNIKKRKNYNSAFCFSYHNLNCERYVKQILVPMGEYFPFSWCRKIAQAFGIFDEFTPGKKTQVFSAQYPLGICICLEETYGHLIRQIKKQGAKILVSLSNDIWFPNSTLAVEHFEHGKLRAVENGFSQIRSCNAGITCAVDCFGRTIKIFSQKNKLPQQSQGILCVDIPIFNYKTLYTFWGDYFILCLSLLCIGTWWLKNRQKKY